ncbi:MAG: transcription antitermination factor NusB [Anaerovoracaceae bacterium]|jgi:N utilization substance protein B
MRRTEARELYMQLLFQMDMQKEYSKELKDKFVKEYMKDSDQLSYFNKLFDLTVQNLEEVDRLIESSSDNWKINRIAKVDLAVLRLSTIEILYLKDIPVSASINEAVDLAKKFSGEESGKFINGILGRVAKNTNVC